MLKTRVLTISFISILIFFFTGFAALLIGSASISPQQIGRVIFQSSGWTEIEKIIILDVRLPRILLAGCIGAGLSLAGLILQALLKNPLAEPYILGISSGAAVGAILGMTIGLGSSLMGTSVPAFGGAVLAMLLVYSVAQKKGRMQTNVLILAGVIIGFFFSSMIVLLMFFADSSLQKITFWLMGDLSNASYQRIWVALPYLVIGSIMAFLGSREINLITAGEETASQLGVNVEWTKRIAYFIASLLTGAVVSVSGVIGFVGLIVPHALRLIIGADHRVLVPASIFIGAAFLIGMDTIARTIISPTELPVGVVTALTGAPFFIYLLRRRYGKRWH